MTTLLKQAIAKVRELPNDEQDAVAALLMSILRTDAAGENLAELRSTIRQSMERGGSYTDEEVAANIDAQLDRWERQRSQT